MIRPSFKTLSLGLVALACLPFGSIASAGPIQWGNSRQSGEHG